MKSFKYLAAAALTLLAVGCNKEQVTEVPDGQMVDVTFTAALPGEMATKALGDGQTAKKLYVSVYENDDAKTKLDLDKTATFTDLKTQVKFSLVKGKTYNFVFWAQAEGAPYDVTDLKNIKVKDYTTGANDEKRDAFYATRKELKVNGALTETIKLYRPFAQVNFATADYTDALKAGFNPAVSSFTASEAATTFDTFAEEGKDKVEVALTETEVPADVLKTLDGKTYTRLAMNYLIPVGKQGESHNIDVAATFKANNGEAVTVSAPNAPVQNNYRTNILGNLLTSQVIFNVEIVPIFNEPDNDQVVANSESEFFAAVAKGGRVTLSHDLTLKSKNLKPTKENTEIVIGDGVTLTGEYSGYTSSVISYFNAVGNQLLTGEGTIVCPSSTKADITSAIAVEDNANVITIDGNLTIRGRQGTKSKAVDAGVIIRAGKVVVNSGHFIASKDVDGQENPAILLYSPNSYRSELVINGGTFESEVGNAKFLINKQAEYVANCKISICGGTFIGFDPADNEADGPHTNYVADGYHSTKVSTDPATGISTYVVTKAGVTPVVNNAGFQAAIGNAASGETILLTAPLTLTSTTIVSDKEVNIDLADNTLVLNKNVYTATSNQEAYDSEATGTITFKNGTIECAGAYSLCPFGKGKMELDNVTLTSANDSPLFVKHGSTLIVKNSKINAKYYGITTNASNPNQNVSIVVDNCEITAGEPILVNIPCNLTVTKSTMNGKWHGTVVRGGTATFTDCKIALDYVDSDAADVAANYNWMGATWGSGNNITIAALVLGNHAPSAYQYPTNVTLKNTTVACEGVNASLFPSVYSYANQGEGLGVTFNYDAASNLESGKGPVYNSANIVVNGVEI